MRSVIISFSYVILLLIYKYALKKYYNNAVFIGTLIIVVGIGSALDGLFMILIMLAIIIGTIFTAKFFVDYINTKKHAIPIFICTALVIAASVIGVHGININKKTLASYNSFSTHVTFYLLENKGMGNSFTYSATVNKQNVLQEKVVKNNGESLIFCNAEITARDEQNHLCNGSNSAIINAYNDWGCSFFVTIYKDNLFGDKSTRATFKVTFEFKGIE